MAVEVKVVPDTVTDPLAGASSVPQSTTVQEVQNITFRCHFLLLV